MNAYHIYLSLVKQAEATYEALQTPSHYLARDDVRAHGSVGGRSAAGPYGAGSYEPQLGRMHRPNLPPIGVPANELRQQELDNARYARETGHASTPKPVYHGEPGLPSTRVHPDLVRAIGEDFAASKSIKEIGRARGLHGHAVRSALKSLGHVL